MELKIVKMRNVFKPRWWQLRLRYRLWRSQRKHDKWRAELSPAERKALDALGEEFHRAILYGKNSENPPPPKGVTP